jgi:hypothetical protein
MVKKFGDNSKITRKFLGTGGMYTCSGCGKRTRETGEDESSVGLCKKCYREYLEENRMGQHGK